MREVVNSQVWRAEWWNCSIFFFSLFVLFFFFFPNFVAIYKRLLVMDCCCGIPVFWWLVMDCCCRIPVFWVLNFGIWLLLFFLKAAIFVKKHFSSSVWCTFQIEVDTRLCLWPNLELFQFMASSVKCIVITIVFVCTVLKFPTITSAQWTCK